MTTTANAVDDQQWALGRNIASLRKAAGLSQAQLAARLTPTVARNTVSRWEVGQCAPERRHLLALAMVFGVSPADLFEQNPAA